VGQVPNADFQAAVGNANMLLGWGGEGGGMGQAAGGAAEGELPGEGVYSDECRTLVVVRWLVD
jgi:hypothetical protein